MFVCYRGGVCYRLTVNKPRHATPGGGTVPAAPDSQTGPSSAALLLDLLKRRQRLPNQGRAYPSSVHPDFAPQSRLQPEAPDCRRTTAKFLWNVCGEWSLVGRMPQYRSLSQYKTLESAPPASEVPTAQSLAVLSFWAPDFSNCRVSCEFVSGAVFAGPHEFLGSVWVT